MGIRVPLKVTGVGRYVLGASSLTGEGSAQFASRYSWDTEVKRPKLPDGGLHVPNTSDVPYQLGAPAPPAASGAVALGDALDPGVSGPEKNEMEFYANRGRASARQMNRVSVDAGGDAQGLPESVAEVQRKCEVCRAFDKAPYSRAAGTSPGLPRNAKFQADLLFAGGAIALCAMDMYSKCPPVVRMRPKKPTGVRDAFPGLRIAVFGGPRTVQIFARSEA